MSRSVSDLVEEATKLTSFDSAIHTPSDEWAYRARTLIGVLSDQVVAMDEEIGLLRARWPRAYILTRASEWSRLFRETHGYIRTCHKQHGTDFEGRQHAMIALDKAAKDLESALRSAPQDSKP